jgi:hypothetical protein
MSLVTEAEFVSIYKKREIIKTYNLHGYTAVCNVRYQTSPG